MFTLMDRIPATLLVNSDRFWDIPNKIPDYIPKNQNLVWGYIPTVTAGQRTTWFFRQLSIDSSFVYKSSFIYANINVHRWFPDHGSISSVVLFFFYWDHPILASEKYFSSETKFSWGWYQLVQKNNQVPEWFLVRAFVGILLFWSGFLVSLARVQCRNEQVPSGNRCVNIFDKRTPSCNCRVVSLFPVMCFLPICGTFVRRWVSM